MAFAPHLARSVFAASLLSAFASTAPAQAQACLEQIVSVQEELQARVPRDTRKPPSQAESIGAQLNRQPTPDSLAQAGETQPASGAWGALNQAMNLQAAGDEAGCMKALGEARRLGGLK